MTLVATLGLGIETGIAIGAIVSILNIIRENASPHMPLLGKVDTEGPQW
jgi:MFS superfamily sulfate permease-like transporter